MDEYRRPRSAAIQQQPSPAPDEANAAVGESPFNPQIGDVVDRTVAALRKGGEMLGLGGP